jgi:DNA-binding CsgD family transcriptional regulator
MMESRGSLTEEDRIRWSRLTEKQRACLDLLLERQTSKQIARHLDISKQAVDLRLTTARDILGAANRDETAIIYARLRQTYDRIPWDPIILPPRPELVPSHFPDGNPDDVMGLHDRSTLKAGRSGDRLPFGIVWRPDYRPSTRIVIIMAMLLATLFMIIAGLAIGDSLTRLVSG